MPPKVLVRRFHKSRDSAFACAHSALVGCSACGLLLPPLPRPCCWHASGHAAMRLARKTTARLLQRACAMPSLCDPDTLAVFARRVLHVSAGRRRGAAAYGSDLRLLSEARTHGCHRSRRYPGLSSRLTWHDFAYVTMAPWIMVDYDAITAYYRPPFLAPSGALAPPSTPSRRHHPETGASRASAWRGSTRDWGVFGGRRS